jgi:DNA-binding Xre family transcriptional regulator
MLKINIQRILAGRAIDRPYTYLINQGFSRSIATRLNTGKIKQLKLSDIERLCLMFECTPNELLEWIPGEKESGQSLRDLIRVNPNVNIRALLNQLPYAKIAEMEDLISEKAKNKGK